MKCIQADNKTFLYKAHPAHEFEYYLIKKIIKNSLVQSEKEHLKACFSAFPDECEEVIDEFFEECSTSNWIQMR